MGNCHDGRGLIIWVVYGNYGPLVILVMVPGAVKVVGLTGEYKNLEGAAIVANKRNAFKLEF